MPYSNKIVVRGKIPSNRAKFRVKASMPLVLEYYGDALKTMLEITGEVKISMEKITVDSVLYTHYSPKLSEIVRITNQKSVNLYAEQLLKHLGYKVRGFGSTKNGLEVVKEYLEKSGVQESQHILLDGSGLSPNNAITPFAIAKVLGSAIKSNHSKEFENSLSTPGISGTLYSFGKNREWSSKVHGKTGTLTNVRSLAGIIECKSGTKFSFCFFVNNYTVGGNEVKSFFEDLLEDIYNKH